MVTAGILLVGGEGSRLGRDKASLVLAGRTLRAAAEGRLAQACSPVVVVDRATAAGGPLAAVAAGRAATAQAAGALVLAVDMPFVTVALLRWLADQTTTVVPVVGGREQFLCARYDGLLLDRAASLVAAGRRSMRDLVAEAGAAVVRAGADRWGEVAAADAFADIDTEADWAAARSLATRDRGILGG